MPADSFFYCSDLVKYKRYKTREVFIGDIPLGGTNPIRIQSMTTTDTMDTEATVAQTIRMVKAGCEYVRITAPSLKEAQNLAEIKKKLKTAGYSVPLIADIHFTPNAAELAARIVEKVRINPGNYIDKKKFQTIDYTDQEYAAELERIRSRFSPLVKICREYGTAMRIGTNHGSLSDRIMSRYGDTPEGMVESALEFLRICEELDYRNIVLSMKASNPQIMVQAYRLLVKSMSKEGMNYPLHLGVTEAGDGEDGRIKSAVGIGTLLEDGLGDTIRVSLTEEPENESPVAILLADRYKNRDSHKEIEPIINIPYNPYSFSRRETNEVLSIGKNNVPVVFIDYSKSKLSSPDDLQHAGYFYDPDIDKWNMNDQSADFIYLGENIPSFTLPNGLKAVYDYASWQKVQDKSSAFPLMSFDQWENEKEKSPFLNLVKFSIDKLNCTEMFKNAGNVVLILETENTHGMAEQRRIFMEFLTKDIKVPVILKRDYTNISAEQLMLFSSTDLGALLLEGFGDGVWVSAENISESNENLLNYSNRVLFGILQAVRQRISKTEYIACPSCGRTLFDLQEVTAKIRSRTEHLKGVKIGIMGCIVNGPGEMADADYGYVGSGVGKITLYRGKNIVKRNIDSEFAVDELIGLIKEDNVWVEAQ